MTLQEPGSRQRAPLLFWNNGGIRAVQRRPRPRGRIQTHVFPYSVPAGRRKYNPLHVGRTPERRSRFRRHSNKE